MLKGIKNILILIVIFGIVTAGIDYVRITSGTTPTFNIRSFDQKTRIQKFRGLFYISTRKIKASEDESLEDSSNIKFQILVFDLSLAVNKKLEKKEYKLEVEKEEDCTNSVLYYADKEIKVYTYCISKINLEEIGKGKKELIKYLEKDNKIIDEIDSNMLFLGIHNDKTTLKFKTENEEFSNMNLSMYRCNKQNINDVYITPLGIGFKNDFCTYKDDDFMFMYEVREEEAEGDLEDTPEVFYEDEINRYEFSKPTKDRVFITTPAVRGKEEQKIPLMYVLNNKILTLDELKAKGLKYNTINKEEERKRIEEELKAEANNQTAETPTE